MTTPRNKTKARPAVAGLPMWLATLAALAVAVAFFVFAMQWSGLIIFAGIIAGLWYGYRWLKRYWPEAADVVASFGRGFLRGLTGRR